MFSGENGPDKAGDPTSRQMRKCIRNYKKEMKSLEYSRLRSLVPSIATQPHVSKIEVIEEAIKYIAYLQATLDSRFEEPIQRSDNERREETEERERRPKVLRQKRQRLASYMIKTQRQTLPASRKFSRRTHKDPEQPR